MNKFTIALAIALAPLFLMAMYAAIWSAILINFVESPLPEDEQVVPNVGIVDEP